MLSTTIATLGGVKNGCGNVIEIDCEVLQIRFAQSNHVVHRLGTMVPEYVAADFACLFQTLDWQREGR